MPAQGLAARAAGFSVADGLPASPVTAIEADAGGRLWVGTRAGLRVLAGGSFVVEAAMAGEELVSPVHRESVNDLDVDPSGVVWVATSGTLHRRTVDGTWQEGLGAEIGLQGGVAAVAATDEDEAWAGGGDAGLARWDGTAWTTVDRTFQVVALTVDGEGRVWAAGGRDGAVLVADPGGPGERELAFGGDGLPDATPQVLAAGDNGVWVGTSDGLVRVVGDAVVAAYDRDAGLPSSSILSLAVEDGGAVWVGTTEGLARIAGGRVDTAIGIGAGLEGTTIQSLALDRTGDLWVGTVTGIVKLAIRSWEQSADPVDGFVSSVGHTTSGAGFAVDDGQLFVAAGEGWTAVPGLDDRLVTTAAPDRSGSLLVATDQGWGTVRDGGFTPDMRCCQDRVNVLLEDASERVWIGTNAGLVVVDDDGPVATFRKSTDQQGLGQDPVTDLWTDASGTVWAATLNGGATPFTDLVPGQRVSVNSTAGGLTSDLVNVGLVIGSGDLWLGTKVGLSRQAEGAWTTEAGVLGGEITALLDAGAGLVWVGTEASGLALVNCGIVVGGACVISLFDEADGLASRHVTSLALADGELWIGTTRGITRHALDTAPPTLSVATLTQVASAAGDFTETTADQFLVDDRPCDAACAAGRLPHDARAADVHLVGMDLEDVDGVRFLVDGGPAGQRIVGFEGVRQLLDAGAAYTLRAVAFDRHFNQSAPAALSFATAATPLPLQPWFWAAVVGAAAVLTGGGWWRWQRRARLAYRDALVSIRPADGGGYEAMSEPGPRPPHWQRVALDTGMLDVLHERFRDTDQASAELLVTLGEALYRPVLGPFEGRLGLRRGRPVRLALDLAAAPELERLPWEVMHGGAALEHLVAEGRLALVRRVRPAESGTPSVVRGRLRVLVAWATPSGMEFGAADECQAIVDAVARTDAAGRIEVIPMEHIRRPTLAAALDDDVDVLHFIGHGRIHGGRPVLMFEGPDRDPHPVDLAMLRDLLDRAEAGTRKPRLVVLSACRSADPADGEGVVSLASGLVTAGVVTAAVGMGYEVYADAAKTFSAQLYASLVRHGQIEHAVAVARSAVRGEFPSTRDWVVPRVYAGDLSAAAYEFIGGSR